MAHCAPIYPDSRSPRVLCSAGLLFATLTVPAGAGSVAYSYDTLGRLTKAGYANGVVITYSYDAAGNRASMAVTGGSAAASMVAAADARVPDTLLATASPVAAPPVAIDLDAGGEDPGLYGWNDLSDTPEQTVSALFTGDGLDRLLHVQGYAIDSSETVGLWLNGTLLGYLSSAADGLWSTPSLWLLPATLQQPGDNLIELRATTPDVVWGVTRLALAAFGSAWGNQEGLPAGDLTHPEGIELHLFSADPQAEAGRLLELAGWDIGHDDEVAITLNGAPLVDLPASAAGAWGATYHLWLEPAALSAGDNRLLISEQYGPLEPWGVRFERVLAGQASLGTGLPDQTPADQRPDGIRLLLPAAATQTLQALRFFDVTRDQDLSLRLDSLRQTPIAVTGAQTWGAAQPLTLPVGMPAVLSIDHESRAGMPNVWGVRIDASQ
nr:RHS repeat domain-containing protein [Allochromatium vinosum]